MIARRDFRRVTAGLQFRARGFIGRLVPQEGGRGCAWKPSQPIRGCA
jgi:hypothetical protein